MTTTSMIPAAKDALVDLLSAHTALQGVAGYRYVPYEVADAEFWYVRGLVEGNQSFVVLRAGRKPRQEEFTITVVYDLTLEGKEPADAESRLFEVYGAIVDVVADDPTLGLTESMFQASLGDQRSNHGYTEDGNAFGSLEADVTVSCRLS